MLEIDRYKTSLNEVFSEERKFELQLLVEKELAEANFQLGKIPKEANDVIQERCTTKFVKLERVKEIEKEVHHDVMSLVFAIAEQCGDYGEYIHLGATSYDIQDTVRGLQLKESKQQILEALQQTIEFSKELTSKYKDLACIGRTHGIHAIPTTYGMKFGNFLNELLLAKETLEQVKVDFGKISGAVGTYASYGTQEIENIVLNKLKLSNQPVTTQVITRVVHAKYIQALSLIASVLEHFAKEIRNLHRTEIDEVRESFDEKQVGSSTMAQKRNPEKSERICGLARVIRSYIQPSLENISLEHERDLSNSSTERVILSQTSILTHYIILQMNKILTSLHLNKEKIRSNLYLREGAQCAENLMIKLTDKIGRQKAHDLLKNLANEDNFTEAVKQNDIISSHFNDEEIERILDPMNYLGLSKEIVQKLLDSL
ncbi:MAG: adenylosuccinate lyase [Candidatus Heimdallarchaeota archaeon]|nr:adenylosuccinate lyase [Candidatus Heimdallarchaeota archaeon]